MAKRSPDSPGSDPKARARRRSLRAGIALVAVLGVVLTAGVAYAASHLVSESIGLAAEPAALDRSLAPDVAPARSSRRTTTTTTRKAAEPQPRRTTTPASAGDSQAEGRSVTQPPAVTTSPARKTEDRTAPNPAETEGSERSGGGSGDSSGDSSGERSEDSPEDSPRESPGSADSDDD
ncbi:MAG: hypothetical protein F2796_04285 [Actinobacteria bacterium]|nr:hypothetical protein [Actinomycetota bacterium]